MFHPAIHQGKGTGEFHNTAGSCSVFKGGLWYVCWCVFWLTVQRGGLNFKTSELWCFSLFFFLYQSFLSLIFIFYRYYLFYKTSFCDPLSISNVYFIFSLICLFFFICGEIFVFIFLPPGGEYLVPMYYSYILIYIVYIFLGQVMLWLLIFGLYVLPVTSVRL